MKLSKIQLDEVQGLQGEFNKAKLSLGDITFQQSLMVKQLEQFQVKFAELEAKLIEEFGQDSVINLKTGEVKSKEEAEADKEEVENKNLKKV
tara:strand:+ start:610 stop:885 length:276 start_codon:yes stop_codon:yes gene_type:complete